MVEQDAGDGGGGAGGAGGDAGAPASAEAGVAGSAPSVEAGKEATPAEPKSLREMIAEAKERVGRGESIVPSDDDGGADGATQKPTADAKASVEKGTGEGEAGVGLAPTGEGEGAEGEGAAGKGGGEAGEREAEFVSVTYPGRGPDDPPIDADVPPELEEAHNRLVNGFMRGEEARRQREAVDVRTSELDAQQAELDLIDRSLQDDPAGFLLERVRPEIRVELLKSLLADDELWKSEELQEAIRSWEHDPTARELFQERSKRERLEGAQKRTQEAQATSAARQGAVATAQIIRGMIPEDWAPDRANKFYGLALRTMGDAAYKKASSRFSRDEVVAELNRSGVLDAYGIDPKASREPASPEGGAGRAGARNGAGGDAGRPKGRPAVRPKAPTTEEALATGQRLKNESTTRRAAAAYAPAGGGAPAAAVELPKGQSVKDRIKTVRGLGGVARVTGKS